MAVTTKQLETELNEVSRKLAEVSGDVERLQRDLSEVKAASAKQQRLSPSVPLDEPHPSASITYSDEEYDDLMERLDAPPNPNDRLRKTMSLHPLPKR